MPSHYDKNIIGNLRGKFDPHYKLASNVEGIEKGLGIEVAQIHKTLSKSFAMQRKTLVRVLGLEKRVNVLELEQAAEEQAKEGIDEILNDLGEEVEQEVEQEVGGGVATKKKLKAKKTKITGAAFKKGTSQESLENIQPDKSQNPDISQFFKESRPDVTAKDITPEIPEPESEEKKSPFSDSFKNILNSIAGSTESIKNLLLGQQKADQQAAKDARKSREDSKRKVKEKKIESRVFDGLKKVGEKVIAPVKGLLGQIWDFIKTLFLSAVVGKLIKWIQNPKNQKKVKSVFRFIKDWWPALLAGWLLFGTGIGSLITGTVAAIAGFIPVLTGLLVPLAAFAASPIGLAVLATGGIAAFLATQKNKTDKAVDESVKTQGRDKTVSDLKEEDANKNIFQKAGGFITGENQERKEQIQRIQTGTEKRYGFFGELPQPAKFNKGGSVPGQGNTDTVPAMLTPGEFVLTKEATEKYGTDTLESMNAAAATGKDETSGTGRLIGSTIGGLTGAVVGFFADTPVSPVADIALGIAGSAAGGEIGDNIERKLTGKGDSATNATQSFRNGGLVQYLNNGGQAKDDGGASSLGSYRVDRDERGGVYTKSTTGGFSGGGLDETTTSTYTRTYTDIFGNEVTVEESDKMREQITSIGVPDLLEHQDQLLSEIHKLKGFKNVTIGQVITQKTGIPQEKLLPILLRSDAQKATSDKKRKAFKDDEKARGIKPGAGDNISANDEVGRSLAGTMGYRMGQTHPDQLIMSSTTFDSSSKESFKTPESNSFSDLR